MYRITVYSAICLALLPACRGGGGGGGGGGARGGEAQRAPAAAAAAPAKIAYLLDAGAPVRVPYSTYPEIVYPVVIRDPVGRRPVPGLFVADSAGITASLDSLVFAAAFNAGGAIIGVIRFHGLSGTIDTLPTPPGYSPNLTNLAASPDGRYIAYIEVDGASQPYGVVRQVSDQSVVARTPPVAAAPVNAQLGLARWLAASRFLLAIDVDVRSDRWARFRGEIGSARLAHDTVPGSNLLLIR